MGTLVTKCLVRQWIHVLRQFGCFCTYFLREGGTRILRSIVSCSPVDVAALVVDTAMVCDMLVFLMVIVARSVQLGSIQLLQLSDDTLR